MEQSKSVPELLRHGHQQIIVWPPFSQKLYENDNAIGRMFSVPYKTVNGKKTRLSSNEHISPADPGFLRGGTNP